MNKWEQWALQDPVGAGIDLAHEAIMDRVRETHRHQWQPWHLADASQAILAEGLDTWAHSPALNGVWAEVISAAGSYLRGFRS